MNLEDCSKDTPEFSLCRLTLQGKVVECYDADTPEMKSKKDKVNRDKVNRDNEIV